MHEVTSAPTFRTSLREFTILMAFLMSIIAISIDALLPALGNIGADFQVSNLNHTQYVIAFIFGGMGLGQLLCGPLSDAMGRKKILFGGIALYLAGSLVCLMAGTFSTLLIGRFIQGLGVAGHYVSTMSIVRDRYSGRDMARVMSIIMMIFIAVPAVAPSLGQAILLLGSWRYVFVLYIVYSIGISVWLALRLEETLPPEKRLPFKLIDIYFGFKEVTSNRVTMSYMLCIGICFGSFIGYLNSSRQIFQVQFNTGKMFTVYFGALALTFGIASLVNSRLVERLGMRYICYRSMSCIVAASAIFLGVHCIADIQLWMFLAYAAILFFSFGLMFGNLNAIAMEPMGHVAGIASAVIGSVSSLISMVLGALIGQLYNNTLIPIVLGFLVLGVLALGTMVYGNSEKKVA